MKPHSLPWGVPRLPQGAQRLILCGKYVDFTMSPKSSLDASWAALGSRRAPLRTPLRSPRLQSCALVYARGTFSLKLLILQSVFAHSDARRLLGGLSRSLQNRPWAPRTAPGPPCAPPEVLWSPPRGRNRPHLAPKVHQKVTTWV